MSIITNHRFAVVKKKYTHNSREILPGEITPNFGGALLLVGKEFLVINCPIMIIRSLLGRIASHHELLLHMANVKFTLLQPITCMTVAQQQTITILPGARGQKRVVTQPEVIWDHSDFSNLRWWIRRR